jgi:hypothetical protein
MCRSRSTKAIGVFIGYLGLFWTKSWVGESLDSFRLYLFLCVLILYLLTRNAFICVFNFSGAKLVPCCPRECSWSLGLVGTVGQVLDVFS